MYNRRIGSLRKLKKELKKGRLNVQEIRLAKLPHPLSIKLSKYYGLIKEEYKAGETIVSINSGDMIQLFEPYKNGTTKIGYRNIWEWNGNGYDKEYDDDFGGHLTLCDCDMFFPSDPLWKKYDHIYRIATVAEERCK